MSNNTPTPGPWSADFVEGEPITSFIQPGRRQDEWRINPPKHPNHKGGEYYNGVSIIASVHGPDMEANARLIAAAPELLASLRALLHQCDYIGAPADHPDMVAARAAIAKAGAREI